MPALAVPEQHNQLAAPVFLKGSQTGIKRIRIAAIECFFVCEYGTACAFPSGQMRIGKCRGEFFRDFPVEQRQIFPAAILPYGFPADSFPAEGNGFPDQVILVHYSLKQFMKRLRPSEFRTETAFKKTINGACAIFRKNLQVSGIKGRDSGDLAGLPVYIYGINPFRMIRIPADDGTIFLHLRDEPGRFLVGHPNHLGQVCPGVRHQVNLDGVRKSRQDQQNGQQERKYMIISAFHMIPPYQS